jgi:hypothetical protein
MKPNADNYKSVKWVWMMDYCQKHRLSPADNSNWKHAERKWEEYRRDLEDQEAGIIEAKGGSDANE